MSGFDVQFIDAARRQVVEHGTQVDFAIVAGLQGDLDAACLQRLTPLDGSVSGVDQDAARCVEDPRRWRRLQTRVDDHTKRLASRLDKSHIKARVVVEHRADAGQDRTGSFSPRMSVDTRGFCGDPLTGTIVQRGPPVERHGGLHTHPWPRTDHSREEADVEFARCLAPFAVDHVDRDAGSTQACDALAGDQGVRVLHGDDHTGHTSVDEGVAARRRAAVVRTGLEGDVGGGISAVMAGLAGGAQSRHFSVGPTGFLRVPKRQNLAIRRRDDAADSRVRFTDANGLMRFEQRTLHQIAVGHCRAIATVGSRDRRQTAHSMGRSVDVVAGSSVVLLAPVHADVAH